ncbi:MAG: AbrB/MazE/SpoVT family DNA-binding domain-containing protein [Gammaproteobacteria bacterium]
MVIATSKLTRKYQATIPEPVREKLHLQAGDVLAFEIEDDTVVVRKARVVDTMFAQALAGTLGEWASAQDEEAYRDL